MTQYYDSTQLRAMARAEEALNPLPAILACGHAPSDHPYWSHTYATTTDGRKICHECHKAEKDSRTLDCGHTPTVPQSDITTGTTHTPDGREICCACADDMQRADLATATKTYGYVDRKRGQITTWTGGKLATLTHAWTIRGGFVGTMLAWNAVDDSGNHWYGRNAGDGMATTLHRAKH